MQVSDFMLRSLFFKIVGLSLLLLPVGAVAQEVHQEFQETISAEVLEIVDEYERDITGTDATAQVQEVRAVLKKGDREGEVVSFDNELVDLQKGDKIFVDRNVTIGGEEYFLYSDFERRGVLLAVAALFMVMLLVLAGWQGLRAIASLGLSIAAIIFLLVPALLSGWSPVLASVGIAGAILAVVLFGTHGFKPRTYIAFGGTFFAVILTGVIAWASTYTMRLTGFSSDASVYLNFATNGQLDLTGLLLGSIIIGILGVLDDVSITQASVVQELKAANNKLEFRDLYIRALKVGKDHIGSLVNTLALAYVAISLPLIMLYTHGDSSLLEVINQEVVAAELLRIIVGSIGLIMAVPTTTAVAAWYFSKRDVDDTEVISHCAQHHH